ncbi:MAG TPA: HlyD family secretion protein [Terriglobales bacterium]|jgi:membrane fusion protein (multidrug efflux system)|nr:HlyD family secretion protein [Terriglobales bacterium]
MAATQDERLETIEEQNRSTDGGARRLQAVETPVRPSATLAPDDQEKPREEEEAAARTAQRKNRLKRFAPLVLVIAALGTLLWWLHARQYEDTDDAQVDGHISQIGSRVAGYVKAVNVEDNQEVQVGQILVEIDPRDYQVALDRARAELADSQAQAVAANYSVPITSVATKSQIESAEADVRNVQSGVAAAHKNLDAARAKLQGAIANNVKAQNDVQRYKGLVERDVISKQQYDAAVAAAESTSSEVQSSQDNVVAAQEAVTQAEARVVQAQANLRNAGTGPRQVSVTQARATSAQSTAAKNHAELEQAQLNLQYTNIIAPSHGIVGHRTAEVGQYVQPGQALISLVDIDNVWITANFKETQLRHMKPGQPVEVKVDASGRKYNGTVQAIGGASGSRFSLFPPENATGNYVKVVQRIPVRIVLDADQNKDHLLRPGMSVVPSVRVR